MFLARSIIKNFGSLLFLFKSQIFFCLLLKIDFLGLDFLHVKWTASRNFFGQKLLLNKMTQDLSMFRSLMEY